MSFSAQVVLGRDRVADQQERGLLCVIGYRDVEDAIEIANDTVYGLAAYVPSASEE
jgi:hypothetical protein